MSDDFYKKHITSLGETHGVVATQDILNDKGQKLVPKNQLLTSQTIEKVINFKLLKPIEELVAVEKEITVSQLYKLFVRYMRESIDLSDIYEASAFKDKLASFCEFALASPLAKQKLTVMHVQLHSTFQQTLFTAWFSAHIYTELGKPLHDTQQAFLAALLRDIGLMHIDPSILSTKEKLSQNQWKQLTSHPIISSKIAENIAYADDICIRAIAEHHESSDGAGFPKGKKESQLNALSQVLNMLDSTFAVYKKSYLPNKRHISDVLPVLQISNRPMISDEFKALLTILKISQVTEHTVITDQKIQDVINEIEQAYHYINHHMHITLRIIGLLKNENNQTFNAIKRKYVQVQQTITQSGLINDAYLRWLIQVKEKKIVSALREAEDAYMMMREVTYHLDKLDTLLSVLLSDNTLNVSFDNIKQLQNDLALKPKPVFTQL